MSSIWPELERADFNNLPSRTKSAQNGVGVGLNISTLSSTVHIAWQFYRRHLAHKTKETADGSIYHTHIHSIHNLDHTKEHTSDQ